MIDDRIDSILKTLPGRFVEYIGIRTPSETNERFLASDRCLPVYQIDPSVEQYTSLEFEQTPRQPTLSSTDSQALWARRPMVIRQIAVRDFITTEDEYHLSTEVLQLPYGNQLLSDLLFKFSSTIRNAIDYEILRTLHSNILETTVDQSITDREPTYEELYTDRQRFGRSAVIPSDSSSLIEELTAPWDMDLRRWRSIDSDTIILPPGCPWSTARRDRRILRPTVPQSPLLHDESIAQRFMLGFSTVETLDAWYYDIPQDRYRRLRQSECLQLAIDQQRRPPQLPSSYDPSMDTPVRQRKRLRFTTNDSSQRSTITDELLFPPQYNTLFDTELYNTKDWVKIFRTVEPLIVQRVNQSISPQQKLVVDLVLNALHEETLNPATAIIPSTDNDEFRNALEITLESTSYSISDFLSKWTTTPDIGVRLPYSGTYGMPGGLDQYEVLLWFIKNRFPVNALYPAILAPPGARAAITTADILITLNVIEKIVEMIKELLPYSPYIHLMNIPFFQRYPIHELVINEILTQHDPVERQHAFIPYRQPVQPLQPPQKLNRWYVLMEDAERFMFAFNQLLSFDRRSIHDPANVLNGFNNTGAQQQSVGQPLSTIDMIAMEVVQLQTLVDFFHRHGYSLNDIDNEDYTKFLNGILLANGDRIGNPILLDSLWNDPPGHPPGSYRRTPFKYYGITMNGPFPLNTVFQQPLQPVDQKIIDLKTNVTTLTITQPIFAVIIHSFFEQFAQQRVSLKGFVSGLPLPFTFVVLQPDIRFTMADGVLLKAGERTGRLLMKGDPSFRWSLDPKTKTLHLYANASFKATITDPSQYIVMRNLSYITYNSGADEDSLHVLVYRYDLNVEHLKETTDFTMYNGIRCYQGFQVDWSTIEQRWSRVVSSRSHLPDRASMVGALSTFNGEQPSLPKEDYKKVLQLIN